MPTWILSAGKSGMSTADKYDASCEHPDVIRGSMQSQPSGGFVESKKAPPKWCPLRSRGGIDRGLEALGIMEHTGSGTRLDSVKEWGVSEKAMSGLHNLYMNRRSRQIEVGAFDGPDKILKSSAEELVKAGLANWVTTDDRHPNLWIKWTAKGEAAHKNG